jgi:hypothetical protein
MGRWGNIADMSDGKFTPKAAVLWSTIPKEARARILAAVFCVKCRGSVTITQFTGEERNGDVILKGACAKCGHEVVRVVETSEEDKSGN